MSAVSAIVLLCKLAVLVAAAWAAVVDVRERLVPYTSMAVVAAGSTVARALLPPFWPSVAAAFVLFILLSLLAGTGAFGGGDAKLIAAAALGESLSGLMTLLLEIALAGGILACLYVVGGWLCRRLAARGEAGGGAGAGGALRHLVAGEVARMRAREPMPYAVAIFAALVWRTTPEVMRCLYSVSCSP